MKGSFSYRGALINRTHRISSLSQIYTDYHSTQISSLSQIYTEEQNIQHFTETLSQPISQNLTAIFSSNALCYLYAGGLLWARNVCQKGSVRSVSSVREKTSTKYASSPVGVTSHTTPLPAGEGLGEGPLSCGLETCAKKVPLDL